MQVAGGLEPEGEAEDPALAQPLSDRLRLVGLQQRQLLAKHVSERTVGRPATVGQAAPDAPQRLRCRAGQPVGELADQPRLAHARIADDRHQAGPPKLAHARVAGLQQLQLAVAADERRSRLRSQARRRPCAQQQPAGGARTDRLREPELEPAPGRRRGALTDHDLAGLGGVRKPPRRRDRAARELRGAGHHHLARVDPDPQGDRSAGALAQPPADRKRGVKRPRDLVLLANGHPERRQNLIAEARLDPSPRLEHLLRHHLVDLAEPGVKAFRIRAFDLSHP